MLDLLRLGSVKTFLLIRTIRTDLAVLPTDLLLDCESNTVSAFVFDPEANAEKRVPMWAGGVTWNGGSRPVPKVRAPARRQAIPRGGIIAFVFVPLLGTSVAAGFLIDSKFFLIVGALLFHQCVPFYIWDFPDISSLLHG
jgi:hypothetical protein